MLIAAVERQGMEVSLDDAVEMGTDEASGRWLVLSKLQCLTILRTGTELLAIANSNPDRTWRVGLGAVETGTLLASCDRCSLMGGGSRGHGSAAAAHTQ